MVAVAMGDQQHVDLSERLEVFVLRRGQRIVDQPRVGDDHLAAGRGDAKGRLAQPLHLDLAAALRVDRAGAQAKHDGERLQKVFHGNLLVVLVCGFSRA